jgi:hypothetical protein
MSDEVRDAFDAFDRRWAERQGVFEQRTHHRVLELVEMPGQDAPRVKWRDAGAFLSRCVPRSEGCATIRAVRTPSGVGSGARSSICRSTKAEANPCIMRRCWTKSVGHTEIRDQPSPQRHDSHPRVTVQEPGPLARGRAAWPSVA